MLKSLSGIYTENTNRVRTRYIFPRREPFGCGRFDVAVGVLLYVPVWNRSLASHHSFVEFIIYR